MNINKKTPAGATNTEQGNENLCTGISTTDPTPKPRINPKNGKPYIFHTLAPELCTETHDHTLCGRSWKRKYSTRPVSNGEYVRQQCPDCAEIVRMQQAAVRRRQRAEKIAAYVEDILERHERGEL